MVKQILIKKVSNNLRIVLMLFTFRKKLHAFFTHTKETIDEENICFLFSLKMCHITGNFCFH